MTVDEVEVRGRSDPRDLAFLREFFGSPRGRASLREAVREVAKRMVTERGG